MDHNSLRVESSGRFPSGTPAASLLANAVKEYYKQLPGVKTQAHREAARADWVTWLLLGMNILRNK